MPHPTLGYTRFSACAALPFGLMTEPAYAARAYRTHSGMQLADLQLLHPPEKNMRRLGALLMIVGANFVVGAIALGFYFSNMACALADSCSGGAFQVYIELMTSLPGLVYWFVMVTGVLLFWRGRSMRRSVINRNGE